MSVNQNDLIQVIAPPDDKLLDEYHQYYDEHKQFYESKAILTVTRVSEHVWDYDGNIWLETKEGRYGLPLPTVKVIYEI